MRDSGSRAAATAAFFLISTAAFAQTPYFTYTYDIWGRSVPSKACYEPDMAITGDSLGIGPFKTPKDMQVDSRGRLWILDSGNGRLVALAPDLSVEAVIDRFFEDGVPVSFSDAEGIFVDDNGLIYVADKGAKLVRVFDGKGNQIRKIGRPESELIPREQEFLPEKVVVDSAGTLYVISFGAYQGALTFNAKGAFTGFFGSNRVTVTAKLLADRIWKSILNRNQRDRMFRYVPTEYVNFTMDSEGFIYTCSNFGETDVGQLRKLNPLGENILWFRSKDVMRRFGDLEQSYENNRAIKTVFVDVSVENGGFINALDSIRGRVFQYDQLSNLIAVFGGIGEQLGTFKSAVAVANFGPAVAVLDESRASVTVFRRTAFGKLVHQAIGLYSDGRYDEALAPWREVRKMDANYGLAYIGIGKALQKTGDYQGALANFRLGWDRRDYSEAYRDFRRDFLKRNFPIVATIIILLFAMPFAFGALRKRYSKPVDHVKDVTPRAFPFYAMVHPFKGFEEMKFERKGRVGIASVILFGVLFVSILVRQNTGFIFNPNRVDRLNLFVVMASTWGVFLLWTVTNWSVCTLMDGNGSFPEIYAFSSYALLPWVLLMPLVTLASNFMLREEGMFLVLVRTLAAGWSAILMLTSIKAVHQFSLKETLFAIILTGLGIGIILLILFLISTLFSQLFSFGATIVNELLLRL
jgi:tetratricopeptide (TPR) repeat protein/TM2 domain-containing membrane protein YozV